MLAKINTLIEVEQQGKLAIEECLAGGKTDVEEIFRKHLEEKDKILKAAEEQREALKKQYIELQANVDESYKQFDESQLKLQNLVRIRNQPFIFCEPIFSITSIFSYILNREFF